jgi:hypothetical protein
LGAIGGYLVAGSGWFARYNPQNPEGRESWMILLGKAAFPNSVLCPGFLLSCDFALAKALSLNW